MFCINCIELNFYFLMMELQLMNTKWFLPFKMIDHSIIWIYFIILCFENVFTHCSLLSCCLSNCSAYCYKGIWYCFIVFNVLWISEWMTSMFVIYWTLKSFVTFCLHNSYKIIIIIIIIIIAGLMSVY